MNVKKIKIGDKEFTLSGSALTLIKYKQITGRDFYNDRNANIESTIKALEFQKKFANITEEDFTKLSEVEQNAYWKEFREIKIDTELNLNIICAMLMAGGDRRTYEEILADIPVSEIQSGSELFDAVCELVDAMYPTNKKKQ